MVFNSTDFDILLAKESCESQEHLPRSSLLRQFDPLVGSSVCTAPEPKLKVIPFNRLSTTAEECEFPGIPQQSAAEDINETLPLVELDALLSGENSEDEIAATNTNNLLIGAPGTSDRALTSVTQVGFCSKSFVLIFFFIPFHSLFFRREMLQ